MSSAVANIILLAPEADIRSRITDALPEAAGYDSPLEALADFAAGSATAIIATTGGLRYRPKEIIAAARSAHPDAAVLVVGPPEEESPMVELTRAGADDYFVWPFGLHELTQAVAARRMPQTIPLPRPDSRPPELRLRASSPQAPAVTTAIRRIMRTLARLGSQPSQQIASQGTDALLEMDELAGVALFDLARPSAPLASAGAPLDAATVAATLLQPSLPVDRWTSVAGNTWLLVGPGEETSQLALAASTLEGPVSAALFDELTTCAGVLMALYSAACRKEAAVRVLSTDGETGLASRRYLDHYLAGLLRRAGSKRREVTLALFSPTGEPSLVGATLRPLAGLMTECLGGADRKLARADDAVLAAVFAGSAVNQEAGHPPGRRIETFARLVAEANLPARVAMATVTFPWHGSNAAELMQAARQRLAESRRRNFLPIVQ